MSIERLKYSWQLKLLACLQLLAILIYLNANIVNVGGMGTALPLLAAYIGLSCLLIAMIWLQKTLYIRFHLLLFLLFIVWIAIRVVVDLGDVEYLKQITVATTGGMLLFYLLGAFLGVSYHSVFKQSSSLLVEKYFLIVFTLLIVWMLYNFSQRLHPRLFYLQDVDGSYQRPGNFLSISFITISFIYLHLVLKRIGQASGAIPTYFWLGLYSATTLMALVGSQLFGSNNATGVMLGVYLITLVMTLTVTKKHIWLNYLKQKISLPLSRRLVKQLVLMAILGLVLFVTLLVFVISVTEFDITSMRLLGFGSGSNNSLLTRIEILAETGANQLNYAPFFGNINVAYLTTGNAGRTIHSFFPFVMANLGVVGLIVVLALFFNVIMQLYRESNKAIEKSLSSYQSNMIGLYSLFILLYVLFFANLATGVSWVVLWFTLGFISKPFGFR